MTCVRIPNGIACLSDEVEHDRSMGDLRTRAGREAEVLAQIKAFGGFSVFWATDNQKRAWALDRLESAGKIRRVRRSPRDRFPWCVYKIAG